MQLPNQLAQAIPTDFKPLLKTAAGTQWFVRHYLDKDGNVIGRDFAMYADVQPILDHNGNQARHNDGWSTDKDKMMRRAASVPFALIEKWKNEEGWDYLNPDHADKARQKLNDIDYRKLRTADWTV
jgi:hypothetical protein